MISPEDWISWEAILEQRERDGDTLTLSRYRLSPVAIPERGRMNMSIFADYQYDPRTMTTKDIYAMASKYTRDYSGNPDDLERLASVLERIIEVHKRREDDSHGSE